MAYDEPVIGGEIVFHRLPVRIGEGDGTGAGDDRFTVTAFDEPGGLKVMVNPGDTPMSGTTIGSRVSY